MTDTPKPRIRLLEVHCEHCASSLVLVGDNDESCFLCSLGHYVPSQMGDSARGYCDAATEDSRAWSRLADSMDALNVAIAQAVDSYTPAMTPDEDAQ